MTVLSKDGQPVTGFTAFDRDIIHNKYKQVVVPLRRFFRIVIPVRGNASRVCGGLTRLVC